MYLKKLDINVQFEAKVSNEVYPKVLNNQIKVLVIHIDWIINSPTLISWLSLNKILKKTRIIAVSTDLNLVQEKWCKENDVLYSLLPVKLSEFKVLIQTINK